MVTIRVTAINNVAETFRQHQQTGIHRFNWALIVKAISNICHITILINGQRYCRQTSTEVPARTAQFVSSRAYVILVLFFYLPGRMSGCPAAVGGEWMNPAFNG